MKPTSPVLLTRIGARRLVHMLLATAVVVATGGAIASPGDPEASDYTVVPPAASTTIGQPNVIISFDISGSMKAAAYPDPGVNWREGVHVNFAPCRKYYGYFESYSGAVATCEAATAEARAGMRSWYRYVANETVGGYFEPVTSAECSDDQCWDGDFLNWLSMRRIDVARRVMVGGKTYRPWTEDATWRPRQKIGNYYILLAQNEPSDYTISHQYSGAADFSPLPDNTLMVTAEGELQISGNGQALSNDLEIGSVDLSWNTSTQAWACVPTRNSYAPANMIVVASTVSDNGGDPVGVRVRTAGDGFDCNGGFEVALQEPDYGDHTTETVTYIVARRGDSTISPQTGALNVSAGTRSANSLEWVDVGLSGFANPVVFTGVGTFNNSDFATDYVHARTRSVGSTGFEVKLQRDEASIGDSLSSSEEIHWIAIESSGGLAELEVTRPGGGGETVQVQVGLSEANVNNNLRSVPFAAEFADAAPLVHASMQTTEDNEPAFVRTRDVSTTAFNVRIAEDATADAEVSHGDEQVGFLAAAVRPLAYQLNAAQTEEPSGVVHDLRSRMRLGVAVFNYNHSRGVDAIHDGNSVDGGTLFPCYKDALKPVADQTNYDICLPTDVRADEREEYAANDEHLIRVIEEHPLIWGTTPTAETLYEIYSYVAQIDHSGGTGSPNYYDNGTDGTRNSYDVSPDWDPYRYGVDNVLNECCRTFVLHVNDGQPYNDWDGSGHPPEIGGEAVDGDQDDDDNPREGDDGSDGNTEILDDLAYWLRTTDIRAGDPGDPGYIEGHQEIVSYYVLAQLGTGQTNDGNARKMREAAAMGGFWDEDDNHQPDCPHPYGGYSSSDWPDCGVTAGNLQKSFIDYIDDAVCEPSEWDKYPVDCNPDTFYTADNGDELAEAIRAAFAGILRNVASGSAAAVVSNRNRDVSGFYRALYYPTKVFGTGNSKKTITWAGRLHALFVDEAGRLREDNPASGTQGKLDGLDIDKAIQLIADDDGVVHIWEYDEGTGSYSETERTVDDLDPVWEARDQLAALSNEAITTNRATYNSSAGQGRWIFTAIGAQVPEQNFSVARNPDKFAFVASQFADTHAQGEKRQRYLNIDPADNDYATNLIDFIRGKEIDGTQWRSRTANFDGNPGDEVWRLGDIIHSEAAVVGAPSGIYYTSYGDTTYREFAEKYTNRRTVTYVGANDGMVHAFNGGFFVSSEEEDFRGFKLELDGETEHPLGSELWAYVPNNLLPHLEWLKDPSYAHVYYVDGPAATYDVNIFNPTADSCVPDADTTCYPEGWGTILVVTMGLGGGAIDIDDDGDGTRERRLSSAVMIFDVTNPEREPTLLAEIADPSDTGFGFTTSTPALVFKRTPGEGTSGWDDADPNEWYLVFGSGPDLDELHSYTTDRDAASLFVIDLTEIVADTPNFADALTAVSTTEARSIISSPLAVDWDLNYETNAVYFGTVAPEYDSDTASWLNAHTNPSGALQRMRVTNGDRETALNPSLWVNELSSVVEPAQPFGNKPAAAYDAKGEWWLYAGTGRLDIQEDVASTEQQSFYGIKEYPGNEDTAVRATSAGVGADRLEDVSDVVVYDDNTLGGTMYGTDIPGGFGFNDLEAKIGDESRGWYIDLGAAGATSATRVLSRAVFNDGFVLFSDYKPEASETCTITGLGRLWEVYGRTGTAHPTFSVESERPPGWAAGDPEVMQPIRAEREGQIFEVGIIEIDGGDDGSDQPDKGLFGEDSGAVGEIDLSGVRPLGGRMSWREIPMDEVR